MQVKHSYLHDYIYVSTNSYHFVNFSISASSGVGIYALDSCTRGKDLSEYKSNDITVDVSFTMEAGHLGCPYQVNYHLSYHNDSFKTETFLSSLLQLTLSVLIAFTQVMSFTGTSPSNYLEIPNNGILDTKYAITVLVNIYPDSTGQTGMYTLNLCW